MIKIFPDGLYCKIHIAGKLQYAPNWTLPKRTISNNELVYVLKGKGNFTINKKKSKVRPGDFLMLLPKIPHSAHTIASDPFQLIYIHFDLFLNQNRKYRLRDQIWSEVQHIPRGLNIEENLIEIVNEFENNSWGSKTVISACMLQVITKVYRLKHNFSLSPAKLKLMNKIKPALDYLYEHFKEECNISYLAKIVHLHPFYLTRIFKHAMGMTPHLFLRKLRIQKAKMLILNTDLSFTQIAEYVGFNSIHHFSRAFKQLERITPSQYLQSIKNV
jgi:AraC-like DNA-binding protein